MIKEYSIKALALEEDLKEYDFSKEQANLNYSNLNYFDRYMIYMSNSRKRNILSKKFNPYKYKFFEVTKNKIREIFCNNKYGTIVDPDSNSKYVQDLYNILWDKNRFDEVLKGSKICGETLNSTNITLNKYYEYIESDIEKEDRQNNYKTKNGKIQNISIMFLLSRYYNEEQSGTLNVIKNNKIITEFMNIYHTIGNFMPIPENCNAPRGRSIIKDYFDINLYCIKKYIDTKDKMWVRRIMESDLRKEMSHSSKKYIQWLDKYNTFNDFIETNYLQDFCDRDKDDYYPRELWKDHFVNIDDLSEYNALPKNADQCLDYFESATNMIKLRSERLIKELIKY